MLIDAGIAWGRCEMVAVKFVKIRKWSEVLRRRAMWRVCVDKELCWWCVR